MISKQTLRKAVIITGLFTCGLSDGFLFGQMSGMLAALQAEGSEIPLNDEDVSWIGSSINITSICGFLAYAIMTDALGRRKITTVMSVPVLISWILVYFAQDKFTLLLSRILLGSFGGVVCLAYIAPAEYIAPNVRSYYTNVVNCFASSLGTSLGHILSVVLHWRHVAIIGIIITAMSAILPFFWIESPFWLSLKGRFEDCEKAFWKLHAHCDASEGELRLLKSVMVKKTSEKMAKQSASYAAAAKNLIRSFKRASVKKIMCLSLFLTMYRTAAIRPLLYTLIITMLETLTGTSDILFFTLVVDGFAIVGSILSCVFVSRSRIRPLLLISGFIANSILVILAVLLYCFPMNSSYVWLKVILLALYFIIINAGLYPMLDTLIGEIYPLDIKSYCILIAGTLSAVLTFLSTRYALTMFSIMEYSGVFLFYAVIVFACLGYIYFHLPETKGRSLQEIELYFKNGGFRNIDDLVEDRGQLVH